MFGLTERSEARLPSWLDMDMYICAGQVTFSCDKYNYYSPIGAKKGKSKKDSRFLRKIILPPGFIPVKTMQGAFWL